MHSPQQQNAKATGVEVSEPRMPSIDTDSERDDDLQEFVCHWRHGPSPGLTYYDGQVNVVACDREQAEARAIRLVARRGCFSPGCITITKVVPA